MLKFRLDSAAFVNSDGDFDNALFRMNMDMVFQSVCQVVRTILAILDNADQMGESWSDWIALMIQIKPGDFGGDKEG
jgi:hypothetical protein